MSDAMGRTEFENLMDEYLRGELDRSKQRAFEEYLELHPEAQSELDDVRGILALTAKVVHDNPPAGLADAAANGLIKQLRSSKKRRSGWFRRPVFAWSFTASLLLVLGLTLWPADSSFVYARLIENLKKVQSVKVQGWVRGENGASIPYRQWVIADGTLRAELGKEDHKRIVVIRENERLIRDFDGQLYHDNTRPGWEEDLEDVLSRLQATYQSPGVPQSGFEYSKEDLGDMVRFKRRDYAIFGNGPSSLKWIMEVDKNTALPTLLQLHQQIDDQWIQISQLQFSEYNTPVAEDFFNLKGTSSPLTEDDEQNFWFELCISPGSIQRPAAHVPDGGLQMYWRTAEEMPEGMSGGASTVMSGGVTTHEYWAMPLWTVVKSLTGQQVVANDLSNQRYSLLLSSKTVLPWKKKLDPVLDHVGLAYEMVPRVNTQRRYIFGQDGSSIQPTLHRFESSAVHADSLGYRFHFEKIPLRRVALSLLGNCDPQGAFTSNDTIEFYWGGDPDKDPFGFDVDLECEIPQATFESNVEFLKKHFGLTMKIEEKKTEILEIRLIKK